MTIEQIRAVHHATPFVPFTIHLADGRSYEVPHRDFLSHSHSGRTVYVTRPDDSLGIIDLLLVTDIVINKNAAPTNGQQAQGQE